MRPKDALPDRHFNAAPRLPRLTEMGEHKNAEPVLDPDLCGACSQGPQVGNVGT